MLLNYDTDEHFNLRKSAELAHLNECYIIMQENINIYENKRMDGQTSRQKVHKHPTL